MTKQDFINTLADPVMAEAKIRLRNLRKELKAVGWKLRYRFYKPVNSFALTITPVVHGSSTDDAFNALHTIDNMRYSNYNTILYQDGVIHGYFDIKLDKDPLEQLFP